MLSEGFSSCICILTEWYWHYWHTIQIKLQIIIFVPKGVYMIQPVSKYMNRRAPTYEISFYSIGLWTWHIRSVILPSIPLYLIITAFSFYKKMPTSRQYYWILYFHPTIMYICVVFSLTWPILHRKINVIKRPSNYVPHRSAPDNIMLYCFRRSR